MSYGRQRSDRREMTVSSDENSGKLYSKDRYSYSGSDTQKKSKRHKKSKKASKSQYESSSESDGGYDSRKENQTARKHKKKSSKEKYERKHLEKSLESEYQDDSEKQIKNRSNKRYKRDMPPRRESPTFKDSRKRSRSQERQRYGKWADAIDNDKDTSSGAKWKDTKTQEVSSKRLRRDKSSDNYGREKNSRYEGNESDDSSWKVRSDHNAESYRKSSKFSRKNIPTDNYSRNKNKYSDENDGNSPKISRLEVDTENYQRSSKFKRKDVSSDEFSKDKSKYQSNENDGNFYRKEIDYDTQNNQKSSKSNRKDISSDKYNIKNRHENNDEANHHRMRSEYDDRETYQKSRRQDRKAVSPEKHSRNKNKEDLGKEIDQNSYKDLYSKKKMSRSYVDLDDPNRSDERMLNEDDNVNTEGAEKGHKKIDNSEPLSKRVKIENINMKTGGAYIPPARLRMMQERIKDKSSEEYQRIAWEALKKSIVGMTNKVNSSNIAEIVQDLFKENIIRGRGVLARAIMQAQGASPTFTRVYAALVSIINTKFPEIGELILKRLIIQYKRGFRRNDKTVCMTAARFLAHLLNQEVAHEIILLEIVSHLLMNPTDDSVEIAISTLKECGKKLTQLTPKGMRAITETVRRVLHEGNVDSRVRYMIEVFFAVQKDGFKDFEIIPEELDLVEDEDKFTHLINLNDAIEAQEMLNVFKFDPEYLENEEKYKSVVKEILGDSEEEGSGAESGSEGEEEEEEEGGEKKEENQQIVDMTETNIVCLRRKIYLTIQSSLDFEECAHKLLKLELKPGQILEMCYMILDCCAQQRTYEKFFGLLAQRFCQLNKIYVEPFTEIFENSYKTIHRLETNKLRNVAKFFAHLLYTDAISWDVLSIIKLNEDDTTSSSRIFIKILFQELCEYMGLPKLNGRVKDVTLQEAFDGLFPRDHPHNTRFAINFFTSIGLGGLTDELREHLKNLPKNPIIPVVSQEKVSSASSTPSSSSSSSSTSSSSSSSSSSDSE